MEKIWKINEQADQEKVAEIANITKFPKPISEILIQRGFSTFEAIQNYFISDITMLHDPYLMKDMDKAVARLTKALEKDEKILIYGDYDVDGTTSVALFINFFRNISSNIGYYVPDRYLEGYGISFDGIDFAKKEGYTLIISLDCGIKAIDKINYAKEKHIDFIICDHHLPGNQIPDAIAVLDPKRADCNYPYKELSGCSVGFKFLHALCIHQSWPLSFLYDYIDLVAVSVACDIVELKGENRILCALGLKKMVENPLPGLSALLEVAGYSKIDGEEKTSKPLTVSNIVFGLGPRINAAGRIAHASHAVKLLIEPDIEAAKILVSEINKNNNDRKEYDTAITLEALTTIESSVELINKKSTVLYNETWLKGVIGIVASRVIEKYYKPTIIFTKHDNKITGSGRSVPGFDLYEAIDACSHLLEQFGGHSHAAGLTIKEENLQSFIDLFEETVASKIIEEQEIPTIKIDTEISLKDINFRMLSLIQKMGPYGPGNMQPVFVTKNVKDDGNGHIIRGKNGINEHLKLFLTQDDCIFNNKPYSVEAIGFNLGHYFDKICIKKKFSICYTIEENNFMNKRNIQLHLKDIQFEN